MVNCFVRYSLDGGRQWQQQILGPQAIRIGRASGNEILLNDPKVSRFHAQIRMDANGVYLLDQNSGNGVFINANRIAPNQWVRVPAGAQVTIGSVLLQIVSQQQTSAATLLNSAPVSVPAQIGQRQARSQNQTQSSRKFGLGYALIGFLIVFGCACLIAGGAALWYFYPQWFGKDVTGIPGGSPSVANNPSLPAAPTFSPPVVLESLPVVPGASVQDDQGVSLSIASESLENGQQAFLERLQLGTDTINTLEQAYRVESLAYSVLLSGGQDAAGRAQLSLSAPSPESQVAVLINDRWLGVLDIPAENGVFQVNAFINPDQSAQTYPIAGGGGESSSNRYIVVTPKQEASHRPVTDAKLARLLPDDADGHSCVAETWTLNHCWRNNEKSVYVFWEDDYPANLSGQDFLVAIDTIKAVASIMQTYRQQGFTAAAIGPSNPVYVVIDAGAVEPNYNFKTGNVYIPWDIIAGINDSANRCTMSHELFHWIEDEEYVMGIAALTPSKSWWLETSAENGAFLQDSVCIDKNLTQYGLVTTDGDILGFQSAPQQWTIGSEQARYIHGLQLYVSLCEGDVGCALSTKAWADAINAGSYPFGGAALAAYETNSKDLGRFLLGAVPQQSRGDAVIPPSAKSGNGFGDYVILKNGGKSSFDYGLTVSQFKGDDKKVDVTAHLERGGVYPLWVGNGTGSPTGRQPGYTGLPGMLEVEAGPAFWLKEDDQEPVFYPVGSKLILGPISDKMGIGTARIVAVERDQARDFKAHLSLIDFSGDFYSERASNMQTDVISCPSYESSNPDGIPAILGYFSLYGEYVQDAIDTQHIHYTWQGQMPEGYIGASEINVTPENVKLTFLIEIPKPTSRLLLPSELGSLALTPSVPPVVAWLPLVGLIGLRTRLRKRGKVLLLLVTFSLMLLLFGCITIWGTVSGEFVLENLEYVGPDSGVTIDQGFSENGLVPNWRFSNGAFDINVDLTIQYEDIETEEIFEEVCQINFSGNADVFVFPDGLITEDMINWGEE